MQRAEKDVFLASMKKDLEASVGAIFLDFNKLTVAQADRMRRKFQDSDLRYVVVKNTLMARVLSETSAADAASFLKGTPTGVVLGKDDPVFMAKITFEFMKECDNIKVKGGVLDSKAITSKEVEALSKMLSKLEMQASIIGLALSPGRKLLAQVKSPAGRIVGAIDKLVQNLEEGQS